MHIEWQQADAQRDAVDLTRLNIEYFRWILAQGQEAFGLSAHEALGMPVDEYVPLQLPKIVGAAPPDGVFYLVHVDGVAMGMGGLRRYDADTAEIKRIYVSPQARGLGLGERIFERLITDATQFGYQGLCLDTAPFMHSAHRIYEAHGFVDVPPYPGCEVPDFLHPRWRFMAKTLPAGTVPA